MISGGGIAAIYPTVRERRNGNRRSAIVKIIEQPASKALRFRYECEGRSAGSIPGANSTPENRTFPSIRIEGYQGRAIVVVSCVTKDLPYRPHPHNLVGKEACKRGVCTLEVASGSTVTFANLGIQCVKRKNIEDALRVREEIRVDPFRTGFSHRAQPSSIDLNAVRLCFQVFLEGSEKGKFSVPLAPVVTDPIYDKKAMSDLVICKLSDCCSTVAGGKEMILLCEKVTKEDIQVRFFEEQDGQVVWEGFADFQPTDVHKQVAIAFKAPRYRVLEVDQPVKVFVQLRRPSDGATSDPLPFEFFPLDSATEAALLASSGAKISRNIDRKSKRKRRYASDSGGQVLRHLQAGTEKHGATQYQPLRPYGSDPIETEPMEQGLPPYQIATGGGIPLGGFSPVYRVQQGTPSPQAPSTMQFYSHQSSPGRTPSPMMDYSGLPGSTQFNILRGNPLHHQQQQQQQHQQPNQFDIPFQFQSTVQQQQYTLLQQQMMVNTVNTDQTGSVFPALVTPGNQNQITENTEGTVGGIGGASSMLNLDNRQYSFESKSINQIDSTDLASFSMFVDNLSQNLSSNLSLSDIRVTQVTAETGTTTTTETTGNSAENGNNMPDNFEGMTTHTMQELCTLNAMYNPPGDNTG